MENRKWKTGKGKANPIRRFSVSGFRFSIFFLCGPLSLRDVDELRPVESPHGGAVVLQEFLVGDEL